MNEIYPYIPFFWDIFNIVQQATVIPEVVSMEQIALLDGPFVSERLVEFVKKRDIAVYATGSVGQMLLGRGIRVLDGQEAKDALASGSTAYSNAESFVPFICDNCSDQGRVEAVRLFKDKARFRKALSDIFPDFYFKELGIHEAESYPVEEGRKLILKPSIGFWSVGIRKFSDEKEFRKGIGEAVREIGEQRRLFDASIIDDKCFVIEDCLEGEEFACDAYFDRNGEPVVVGLYCHRFRDSEDVRDLVYYTGKKVMQKTLGKTTGFLRELSKRIRLRNFPVHFEFIIEKSGRLVPVEVNPMRFGGFGLVDLGFYAFGVDAYGCFFEEKKPDWERILKNSNDDYFGFVLGRMDGIRTPDVKKFKRSFRKLKEFIEMDYRNSPVFAIAYAQSSDLNELIKYVYFEFREYEMARS